MFAKYGVKRCIAFGFESIMVSDKNSLNEAAIIVCVSKANIIVANGVLTKTLKSNDIEVMNSNVVKSVNASFGALSPLINNSHKA